MPRDSGLAGAPVMFLFLDVSSVSRHRKLYERELGFRVIENQFHPPHEHHGLVKYDAGGTILAVNAFAERKFRDSRHDGLILDCRTTAHPQRHALDRYGQLDGTHFTDMDGHHYILSTELLDTSELDIEISALRIQVDDLAGSISFYRDVLGLPVQDQECHSCRFQTGTLDIYLDHESPLPRDIHFNAALVVFYTDDVVATEHALEQRGLVFTSRAGESDIGVTARFRDPTGHIFCLYQPSEESLTWGSAAKVMELMAVAASIDR